MTQTPNILLIMTDQHHAGCLGYRGHPDVKTPNVDRLAAEGVRFDECFCQNGICVPSRTSYLTGQYCHTHGVFGDDLDGFPPGLLSLPAYLQAFGYQTAIVGKKHLPGWREHGFQYERLCYHADAPVRNLHYYNYLKQHGLHALYDDLGDVTKFCMTDGPKVPVEHSLEVWTGDETLKYLDSHAGNRPFFLMTSFERPHPPLTVPDGCPFVYDPDRITLPENREEAIATSPFYFNRNVELKWCVSCHGERVLREALCAYYALISLIDREIGRILDWLDTHGLTDSTIVIFCADHGDFAGEYSKMAKGWNYDAIHRVPFVWRWPGRFGKGTVKDGLVETVDMFPTLCSFLGVPAPKTLQGRNISELLASDSNSVRDAVFFEYLDAKTVRTKNYKLSYGLDDTRQIGELFDLREDPHTLTNLFDNPACAGVREQMLRRLMDWWIATQQPPNFPPTDEHLPPSRWFQGHDSVVI